MTPESDARPITADYLVVGAGAMAMAFVDTLLHHTGATVVIVDRNDRPGGHWLTAYPFVRLHQPSAYYGVNSRPLGTGALDAQGWNAGYFELAGGAEICAYYDTVMRQDFLSTGRVQYFPMSDYLGDRRFRTLDGRVREVTVGRRVVDATYLGVVAPSMRPPAYAVAPGVDCIPPNALPQQPGRDRYVVVGAGKTAFDACLWLIGHGIDPDRLSWIVPRDSWLLDRGTIQPGPTFAKQVLADYSAAMKAIHKAETIDDLYDRLAQAGCLRRIDETATPSMYRCAILADAELQALRRITDVVRLGHVTAIEPGRVTLEHGTFDTDPDALYVDCTGDGLPGGRAKPVFDGDTITLQPVRTCQPTFSGAVIGYVEATKDDDAVRNEYCRPVPHPRTPRDWLTTTVEFNRNQLHWFTDPDMIAWLDGSRLNVMSHLGAGLPPEAYAFLCQRLREANTKLEALLAGEPAGAAV